MAKKNVTYYIDEEIPSQLEIVKKSDKLPKELQGRSVNYIVDDTLKKFIKKYNK